MEKQIMLITGSRKGIGNYLTKYYTEKGFFVIGCSRREADFKLDNYKHYCVDVADEKSVKNLFSEIRKNYGRLDILINNAGIAAMNHFLLTPMKTVNDVLNTNIIGTFLFCREAAKLMQKNKYGRIVNFTTVAVPLKLEGEAIYAASKAAVNTLTHVLAGELSEMGITVNAVGPTPIKTDLIRNVPEDKIQKLLDRQPIKRFGEFEDVANVIDFFIKPESSFVTSQIIYLGGL